MTNQDKFKKVIEYAVERGWKEGETASGELVEVGSFYGELFYEKWDGGDGILQVPVEKFIFSRDFAKAVFGKKPYWFFSVKDSQKESHPSFKSIKSWKTSRWGGMENYQYHLQKAVISEDPIDYYYQYVKTKHGN